MSATVPLRTVIVGETVGRAAAADRFSQYVEPQGDCLVWTANRDKRGYGKFRFDNGTRLAHRVSWELANGPIPDGLWVLHRCDNPPCVNVEHLYLGTHLDNMRDMRERVRHPWFGRTRCASGEHEYTTENTIIDKNGRRRCRECKRQAEHRRWVAANGRLSSDRPSKSLEMTMSRPAPVVRPNGKVWRGRLPLRWTEFAGVDDDAGLVVFGTLDVELAATVVGESRLAEYGCCVEDGEPDWWREVPWSSGGYDYSWVTHPERGTPCVFWIPR